MSLPLRMKGRLQVPQVRGSVQVAQVRGQGRQLAVG